MVMDITGMVGYMHKGFGGMFPGFWHFGGLLGLLILVFWVWMLFDCLKRDFKGNDKIAWVLVIIFAKVIGAAIYLFAVKSKDKK
jgi:hypothetical protein